MPSNGKAAYHRTCYRSSLAEPSSQIFYGKLWKGCDSCESCGNMSSCWSSLESLELVIIMWIVVVVVYIRLN